PLVDDHYMHRKVRVVDVETGKVSARLDNPGKLGPIAWSPDGQHLAVVSAADLHDPQQGRLWVAPATGGDWHDLLPKYEAHVTGIAWRDAETVLYLADEGVHTTLGTVKRDGSGRQTLVAPGGPVVAGLTVSRDGKAAAFVGTSPRHPPEVFLRGP